MGSDLTTLRNYGQSGKLLRQSQEDWHGFEEKRYTRVFKIETVRLLSDSDQSVTEITKDQEVHSNTQHNLTVTPNLSHRIFPSKEMTCGKNTVISMEPPSMTR